MKIFITGNAGSGKSTLGKKLAATLDAPFYTLDKIVWQEGWKKTPMPERQRLLSLLTAEPAWVIDGVSDDVQNAADITIFLDLPRRTSYWRALNRSRKHLFSSRPDLPPRCPEILIIPTLIKIIWRFPRKIRPRILALGKKNPALFIHITAGKDAERLIARQLADYAGGHDNGDRDK